MNPISFPNLNLSFNINPVAIQIGSVQIYWYGLLIAIAIMLGIILCKKSNGTYGLDYNDVFDYLFYAIFLGIACARLYYIAFNLDFYLKKPTEIIMLHHRWSCNLWWNYRSNYYSYCVL